MSSEPEWQPQLFESLDARPDESAKAYAAFLDYIRLGPTRSLRKLLEQYRVQSEVKPGTENPPTRRLATLSDWSVKYEWQARLRAYFEERRQRDQAEWEERQREVRQLDWDIGGALRQQVVQALAQMPQFLKTTRQYIKGQDGEPDREVVQIQQDLTALLKAAELASKLQRQAAEILPPAQRHEVTGKDGRPVTVADVSAVQSVTPGMAAAAQAALKAALTAGDAENEETSDDSGDNASDSAQP